MFALLASDSASDTAVLGGATVAALLAALSSMAGQLFTWLSNRDKLRYDAAALELRGKVVLLQEQSAACQADRLELRTELDKQEKRLSESEADRERLHEEIAELRERLYGPGSGGHRPPKE